MIQSLPTQSKVQLSRSKHSIYISSIGKVLGKEISCHVKKEEKGILFEKKYPTLAKALSKIHHNVQKDAFRAILIFTDLKRNYSNEIFLPQAILKNDIEAIKSFKEKLSTTQIDRYISLHMSVNRSKSARSEKSCSNSTTIQKEKDVDSTCLGNRPRSTHCSKSIDVSKVSQKIKISDVKVFEYDSLNSRSQVSKSRGKRDIIHIKYTEMVLQSERTPQIKKIVNDKSLSSTVKVKEFRTEDFGEVTELFGKERLIKGKNDLYNSKGGHTHSPYIGKNRIKNTKKVNFSCGREFKNIDIHC